MADPPVIWENSDEWHVVGDKSIAMIANPERVHECDKEDMRHSFDGTCGDCYLIRTPTCQRCFHWPMLLIHDTFCGPEARSEHHLGTISDADDV
jgi:hypothetical protein